SQGRGATAQGERGVAEVNRLSPEAQRAELASIAPERLEKPTPSTGPKELPPLPKAVEGQVVLRLAPYPSGPLHIGNARAFVLNEAYAKKYRSGLLLVFDDTMAAARKPTVPQTDERART